MFLAIVVKFPLSPVMHAYTTRYKYLVNINVISKHRLCDGVISKMLLKLGMLKSFFLKIDYRLLKIDFSQLSFPDVKVTAGCSNILGCCTVRSYEAAAVKAGGGEAGLQRRTLNRPALHTASNSHLLSPEMKLCGLVNRPSMNGIHLYLAVRPASLPHTTSQSVSQPQRMWGERARAGM